MYPYEYEGQTEPKPEAKNTEAWAIAIILGVVIILVCLFFVGKAHAEEINVNKLANAIYLAEGGARTTHPYGILTHYKHTSARQACVNTIKHALRDFRGGDFIRFLQQRYAPIGVSNDPKGLNKNWYKNVTKFYEQN